MHGTYLDIEGRPALRFERVLDHPVDAVWAAITEPSELAHWFPARVEVDLRPGGGMTFTFADDAFPVMHGEVTELDPPRRFAFEWGGERMSFDLEPEDGGCRLVFIHFLSERDAAARDAAGWHVCLDQMRARLAGPPAEAPGTEPTEEHRALMDEYERRGMPTGAPLPGG